MSADLFEAFGSQLQSSDKPSDHNNAKPEATTTKSNVKPEIETTWQPWPSHSPNHPVTPRHAAPNLWDQDEQGNTVLFDAGASAVGRLPEPECDEDDFGDFEKAHPDLTTTLPKTTLEPLSKHATNLLDLDESDIVVPQDTFEAAPNSQLQFTKPSFTVQSKPEPLKHDAVPPAATPPAVDDDWGHFEEFITPESSSADNKHKSGVRSILSSSSTNGNKVLNNMSEIRQVTVPTGSIKTTQLNGDDEDGFGDDWDDFEDGPPSASAEARSDKQQQTQYVLKPPVRAPEVSQERPTNVPPPAILLALLPKVFSSLAADAQSSEMDGTTSATLVEVYRTCARIISGRQLRWKRDTILAQSMRIGTAGRSGGMKLTSLDKGETRKEDQEAEEAIKAWSYPSYRLNAAMTKAKVPRPPMALSTRLVIRTVTGPDVLTANHVCAICGLKRNERITGIDINVSDVFGEFWKEHWGHTDCYRFWYQFNGLLDQR